MYYVYVLQCAGGSYYTGYTPALSRRMQAHAAGKGGSYTRAFPPRELAAVWQCEEATGARRLEYAIKHRLNHREKEALLAAPATVTAVFPQLDAHTFTPLFVTLRDCLEGRFHG